MKNVMKHYTHRILKLMIVMLIFAIMPLGASSQQQYINGQGTPNYQHVRDSYNRQNNTPEPLPFEKNKTMEERIAEMQSNINGNINQSKTNNLQAFFWTEINDQNLLLTNNNILFSAAAQTNYAIDSSDVIFTVDYGDGTQQTFNDSRNLLPAYSNNFYRLFVHAYSAPGNYFPTCKVITATGDTSIVNMNSNGGMLTIHNGVIPSPAITDFGAYSDQICDSLTLYYNGTQTWANVMTFDIQSMDDFFTEKIDFGDGTDTTLLFPIFDLLWNSHCQNGMISLCEPYLRHVYISPGSYTMQAIITFPNGQIDTAYRDVHIASHCNEVSGTVFIDNNGNCLKDPGEQGIPNIYLTTGNQDSTGFLGYYFDCQGQFYSALTNFRGEYAFFIPDHCDNNDSIFLDPYWNYYGMHYLPVSCPTAGYYTFISNTTSLNNNFALGCTSGFDLEGYLTGWRFRPGFQGYIYAYFGNLQCDSIDGTAKLVIENPGYLTIDSVTPAPLSIVGDTITWAFSDLSIYDFFKYGVAYVTLDPSAPMGDTINTTLTLFPATGDNNPTNNEFSADFIVTNSWDPNEKTALPQSTRSEGFVSPDKELTYIIHFQNTGTDTAYNIRVVDTIDSDVDLSTFHVLTSSHYMTFTINGRVVTFNFPSIMLPDSGANVAASQGFVSYKVKPRYGLAEGTQIKNTGYIYFDYNPAVVTNTTLNTISYFSDIAETVPGNGISVFPNPAHHEFTVTVDNVGKNETIYMYDVFGKQVLSVPVTETSTVIDVRSLSAGVYFMRLTGNNNNSVQKIIIE